jgi:hypothetical protein
LSHVPTFLSAECGGGRTQPASLTDERPPGLVSEPWTGSLAKKQDYVIQTT